jgi:hypothetical protein
MRDFMAGVNDDAMLRSEGLWSTGYQAAFLVDQTGDVIGDASGGI